MVAPRSKPPDWKAPEWIESLLGPKWVPQQAVTMSDDGSCTREGCECPMFGGNLRPAGIAGIPPVSIS